MPRLGILLCTGLIAFRGHGPAVGDVYDFALDFASRNKPAELISAAASAATAELMAAVSEHLDLPALIQSSLDMATPPADVFILSAAIPAEASVPIRASMGTFMSEEVLEVFRFPIAPAETALSNEHMNGGPWPLIDALSTGSSVYSTPDLVGKSFSSSTAGRLPSADPRSAVPLMPRESVGGPVPTVPSPFFEWLESNADLLAVMAMGIILGWALFDQIRRREAGGASGGSLRQPPSLRRRL